MADQGRRDSLGRRINRVYRRRPLAERFWEKVNRAKGCWLWAGACDHRGYGTIYVDGRTQRAHRIAWLLTVGEIPSGYCVLHHCDNPPCVRPDHLFLGTLRDNTQDMMRKGRNRAVPPQRKLDHRQVRGEQVALAKLTTTDVVEIRRRYSEGENSYTLGTAFNVNASTIQRVVRRTTWRHVVDALGWGAS